jgi:CBS domain-containing protein
MALIGSLMKTELTTAKTGETVAHAAWSMARNGVGAVLVIEDGELRGILSERDVVERVVAEGRDPAETTVAEVMTTEVASVDSETPVRMCAQLLREKNIRHLPVFRDGKPTGILSSRDFFVYVVDGLERVVDRLRYQEELAEGEDPYDHIGGGYGE